MASKKKKRRKPKKKQIQNEAEPKERPTSTQPDTGSGQQIQNNTENGNKIQDNNESNLPSESSIEQTPVNNGNINFGTTAVTNKPSPNVPCNSARTEEVSGGKPSSAPISESKVKSWSSIVSRQENTIAQRVQPQSDPEAKTYATHSVKQSSKPTEILETLPSFQNIKFEMSPAFFVHPRGFVNRGNTCFLNCVFQSLIACTPFFNLLHFLSNKRLPSHAVVLSKCIQLAKEFETTPISNCQKQIINSTKPPISPSYFDDVLKLFIAKTEGVTDNSSRKFVRKQEDAQEFLSFLLDTLNEEMLEDNSKKKNNASGLTQAEEWQEVGRKNRLSHVVEMDFIETPINYIFGIQIRSIVRKHGSKASVTMQPSNLLPLDISQRNIKSLDQALNFFLSTERIDGITDSRSQTEIAASKQMGFEKLPKILIVQLKRFAFDNLNGSTKIDKFIAFPSQLNLSTTSGQARSYSLFSVLSHCGKDSKQGHYICDTLAANGQWIMNDDHIIQQTTLQDVLKRKAYLLFYNLLP